MAIDDLEYHDLLLRVRELRRVAEGLGSLGTPAIYAGVDAQLERKKLGFELPQGQRELVDEIVGILSRPRLSSEQARGLARAFRTFEMSR